MYIYSLKYKDTVKKNRVDQSEIQDKIMLFSLNKLIS